jgi:hypothetical protein
MANGTNMDDGSSNPIWIAIVVLTAALMVIFLLFFGSHAPQQEAVPSTPIENSGTPSAPSAPAAPKVVVPEQPGPASGAGVK